MKNKHIEIICSGDGKDKMIIKAKDLIELKREICEYDKNNINVKLSYHIKNNDSFWILYDCEKTATEHFEYVKKQLSGEIVLNKHYLNACLAEKKAEKARKKFQKTIDRFGKDYFTDNPTSKPLENLKEYRFGYLLDAIKNKEFVFENQQKDTITVYENKNNITFSLGVGEGCNHINFTNEEIKKFSKLLNSIVYKDNPTNELDKNIYKELLMKYIQYIKDIEGADYITDFNEQVNSKVEFTHEDLELLHELIFQMIK